MANPQNLKPFKKGYDARRGHKPKGTLNLSTHIQNLLNDESFTVNNLQPNGKQFKGAPIKAIITVAIMQSLQGDRSWADWLARYGYGTSVESIADEVNIKYEFVNKVPLHKD